MERDAVERRCHLVERMLEILLPEEAGVAQSRADHLLVASDDLLAVVRRDQVRYREEAVRQRASFRITQREALLMRLHRCDQAFGRHFEKRLVEVTHQHGRPFGETGVLAEQRVVGDQLELVLLRECLRLLVDHRGTFGRWQQHLRLAQLGAVVFEARNLERFVAVEAMPPRRVRRLDACPRKRHDARTEHAHDAVQRTHPDFWAAAPSLRFRPRELAEHGRHHVSDDVGGGAPVLLDLRDVVVALLVADDGRVADRGEARGLEEAGDRLLGRADARAFAFVGHGGRACRYVANDQRQSARRRECHGVTDSETGSGDALEHETLEVIGRARLHAGGDFFGE